MLLAATPISRGYREAREGFGPRVATSRVFQAAKAVVEGRSRGVAPTELALEGLQHLSVRSRPP